MTTTQRYACYLVDWLYFVYCKKCNLQENFARMPAYCASYPLADVLPQNSDDEFNPDNLFNTIIDKLPRYVSSNVDKDFWYEIIDWVNNNPEFIADCNGRRLLEHIKSCIHRYEAYIPDGVVTIFSILYQRIVMRKANPDDVEIEAKSKEMYEGVINFIKTFEKMLPKRTMYVRFSPSLRKLVETTDPEWKLIPSHSNFVKDFVADKTKLHFGFELEGAFPSNDAFQACCNELQAQGFLNKDEYMLYPTYDGSIRGVFKVEWVFAPLTLEDGAIWWPRFMETLHRNGFSHSTEINNSGLHIHFDRDFLTAREQLKFNEKMLAIPNKREYFGRISQNFAPWSDLADSYNVQTSLVRVGEVNPDGTVLCKEDIKITGIEKMAAINYMHKNSIEIRAYNASKADNLLGIITDLNGIIMSCKSSNSSAEGGSN